MKKASCIFLLISLCFVVSCTQNDNSSGTSMTEGGNAGAMFYRDIDRTLTEDDFAFLERGMSLEEIVAVVGMENGIIGFNILTPFYTLTNGRLFLSFDPPFGGFESLIAATIEYSDGSSGTIDLE